MESNTTPSFIKKIFGNSSNLKNPKITDFIEKAKSVHEDKYDYSQIIEWKGNKSKVPIVCPVHGTFWQIPISHIYGCGCKACGYDKQKNISNQDIKIATFIEKAKMVHGNKYDYSQIIEWKGIHGKVPIVCPVHKTFLQSPANHLSNHGCIKCKHDRQKSNILDLVKRFKEIHDPLRISKNLPIYDFSMFNIYHGSEQKIPVVCHVKDHGIFYITVHNCLQGYGCLKCANDSQRSTTKSFIEKALKVHGTFIKKAPTYFDWDETLPRYDYSKVEYTNNVTKVLIKCNKCNYEFKQQPSSHLNGQGCPHCAHHVSKPELNLREFIKTLIPEKYLVFNDRKLISPYELDIFIRQPYNLALEYNGTYYHSKKPHGYHDEKTRRCKELNIKLIHVFESAWNDPITQEKIKFTITRYVHRINEIQAPYFESLSKPLTL
jgi:hypothetical protein